MPEEKDSRKPILVLGATGSVGKQALDVAAQRGFPVEALSANRDVAAAETAARRFCVRACAMADEEAANDLALRLADTRVKVYAGAAGITEMIRESEADTAVNAIVGEAGLAPTVAALESGKRLALANKESLVVAGEIVMRLAKEKNCPILPVDSEHCAVAQCLRAGRQEEVKRLILTASGGPFYGMRREELEKKTVRDALAHPTWSMGAKITVDSATMMNKGFEIMEAAWLFGIPADRISVVVHRESIIHSMVEYIDNSIIAQLAVPDMRLCVQHALCDPVRKEAAVPALDLLSVGKLTFLPPDEETFVPLRLARTALEKGGALPAVLNAANEVAVSAFLREKIGICTLFTVLEKTTEAMQSAANAHSLEEISAFDAEARAFAERIIRP